MDIKLTHQDVWLSTLIFAVLGIITLIPLIIVFRDDLFERSSWTTVGAAAVFWGLAATLAMIAFWELYYVYIFPSWARWLAPFDALLYGIIALLMWWLASQLPGIAVLWFVILGGVEGILEHALGVYGLHILDKVPWLEGISPFPVVVFSFFEYVFYWSLVAWLAYILARLFRV
jgi:hypothetical protein